MKSRSRLPHGPREPAPLCHAWRPTAGCKGGATEGGRAGGSVGGLTGPRRKHCKDSAGGSVGDSERMVKGSSAGGTARMQGQHMGEASEWTGMFVSSVSSTHLLSSPLRGTKAEVPKDPRLTAPWFHALQMSCPTAAIHLVPAQAPGNHASPCLPRGCHRHQTAPLQLPQPAPAPQPPNPPCTYNTQPTTYNRVVIVIKLRPCSCPSLHLPSPTHTSLDLQSKT